MSINRVNISGNLTRDPELRATTAGTQILNFGVAVNDRARDPQSGEWVDRPNFIDCVVFGSRADALSRLLHKGMKVAIEGKLRYSSWEKDGQKRSKIEVVVDEIEFLSQRAQGDSQGQYQQTQPQYPQAQPQPQYSQDGYAQAGYQQPGFSAPAPAPAAAPQAMPAAPAAAPAPMNAPADTDVYDTEIPF